MHTDVMALLEQHNEQLLQLKELHMNNNMQQIELENKVLQQSALGNKCLTNKKKPK